MNRIAHALMVFLAMMLTLACRQAEQKKGEEPAEEGRTPVLAESVSSEPMSEYVELNATSAFQQKSYLKSNVNGYLISNATHLGDYVTRGKVLFTVKTKESQSIGDAVNRLDTTLRFSGTNTIVANETGYITQLDHQSGDYVQDGEQLAVISNMSSFVFLLDLPYELRPFVVGKRTVQMILPDGEKMTGTVGAFMPMVDATSQTQGLVIHVSPPHPIPENLIARVRIVKREKTDALSLPKSAILTDETQSAFWVMRLMDSATAVKVPVKKGIETGGRVEILSPKFSLADLILVSGNYGLPDTAKVVVQKPGE
jgi:multidrug efflux pump subunit AcrA (membrane-fusion protein)